MGIARDKQKIINLKGSPVLIYTVDENVIKTMSIIGRASTQFNSTLSLEAHRRGHFFPEIDIKNGYLVEDTLKKETYVCVANYSEVIDGSITTTVAHMLVCNGNIKATREVEVGDDRGKVTKTSITIVEDYKVCIETKKQELKQFKPGLHPDFDYEIYAPYFEVKLLDSIEVKNDNQTLQLKVESFDSITYPGLVVIQLSTETRR